MRHTVHTNTKKTSLKWDIYTYNFGHSISHTLPFIFYTSITHMLPDLLQYNLQPCPLLRLSVLHSKNNHYFKYTTLDNMKFLKQAHMNSQGKETVTELNSLEPLLGKHDVGPLNLCPFNLKG